MSHAATRLIAARAAIARACLDALPPEQLGDIVLRADQRRIVGRARRALETHGGCLIGEDVGRGKTFIAIALARRWHAPLVVAPAALRSTWLAALARARIECGVISHESLSRRRVPQHPFDALIVDESHHFRNPATTRFAELTRLAASVPIVLLSATPLQNRARDLAAQIALFYGDAAFALEPESLARFIIRGDDIHRDEMPVVAPPEWIPLHADDGAVLTALLDLPPPPRPIDGGDAGALRMIALVRAWASSRAALKATLRSRRRVATAIAQGVEVGRAPTRRETREWRSAEGVVQLGFAAVLMRQSVSVDSSSDIRLQLEQDDAAYHRVRAALLATSDPDLVRVAAIRSLRAAHHDSRIIAFSEYASTVSTYFDALRRDAGVGMLTSHGARIATGRISRDELLVRFAPRAQGGEERAAHHAVTLLLTTDILSEGVNLQDASIVVHLDLPWNPARLSQRVGRVRRPGGSAVVRSLLMAPPASADALLSADARLRRKMEDARRIVGVTFDVLPTLVATGATVESASRPWTSNAAAVGTLVERLERWSRAVSEDRLTAIAPSRATDAASMRGIALGAAVHSRRGWLAALSDGRIVGAVDGVTTDAASYLATNASAADGEAREATPAEIRAALEELDRSIREEHLLEVCGAGPEMGPLRRGTALRLATMGRCARRYEQARMLSVVSQLGVHLAAPMPLGAEQSLMSAVTQAAADAEGGLAQLTTALHRLNAARSSRGLVSGAREVPRVVALIVVGPATATPRT